MLGMGFDAQRFELFLYLLRQWEVLSLTTRGFDAQGFELFLYLLQEWKRQLTQVSMLNFLSFFFIRIDPY